MLYIVSTPIGNLGDITYRAVEVLKSVDLIACEDTRHTKILLTAYGIKAPLISYHSYSNTARECQILKLLKEGKKVALVSDAGTPGISDPGYGLIKKALEAGIEVVSVPGPTAFIAALSISGLPTHKFYYEGFLPVKSGARKNRLTWLKSLETTIVVYESPHRFLKTLEDILAVLGDIEVVVAREITKKFEEVVRGKVSAVIQRFTEHKPRGEFVLMFK
ncbi:MAG: 16S rRNA (cytidine(1402)-2'-O)-methyltransferase [Candidatus Omnitrophota bacterium]